MKFTKWIDIDDTGSRNVQRLDIHGVPTRVLVGPHDNPLRVRSLLGERGEVLGVEVQYLDSEETVPQQMEAGKVQVLVGKNSGRVFQLHIDAHVKSPHVKVFDLMEGALGQVVKNSKKTGGEAANNRVLNVLKDKKKQLQAPEASNKEQ